MLDLQAVFGDFESTPEAATPETSTEAPGFDFSDWVRRSDCRGRMGWERPGLPEDVAWWRWADFDELPEADWTCPECGGLLWWEDLLGGKHCLRCEFDKHERSASTLRSVQASGVIPPQR